MKNFKVKISPSILDSNFADIKKTIKMLERAKADFIHFDVMDGNFVPNITFGPKLIKPLRPLTNIPFDTHLMIKNPEKYSDSFINAGSDIVTLHLSRKERFRRNKKDKKTREKSRPLNKTENTRFKDHEIP